MSAPPGDRLSAAKLWLVDGPGQQPYVATALYSLVTVWTDSVTTMTVDTRWRLYANPTWVQVEEVPTLAARLAQLVWHLLADHAGRAHDVAQGAFWRAHWRTATEVTVGELLSAAGIRHALPTAQERGLSPGRSAEEHYATLTKLSPPPPGENQSDLGNAQDSTSGSGVDGIARWYEQLVDEPGLDTASGEEVRRRVAIEYRAHLDRTPGTSPGEWSRWVSDVLDPTVPWHQVLATSVRRAIAWAQGNSDYSYSRRSRRQGAVPRVVLPGLRRAVPQVVVVVDTSGSVDDGLLARALAEVDGVLLGLGVPGSSVEVLAVDADVQGSSRVTRAARARLAGGGGTDMRVGVTAALSRRPRPDVIVVLTDGWTPWPDSAPAGVVVIAGLLGRSVAELPPTPSWLVRVECVSG
jgi:predicted metal-dependent peptidase